MIRILFPAHTQLSQNAMARCHDSLSGSILLGSLQGHLDLLHAMTPVKLQSPGVCHIVTIVKP